MDNQLSKEQQNFIDELRDAQVGSVDVWTACLGIIFMAILTLVTFLPVTS